MVRKLFLLIVLCTALPAFADNAPAKKAAPAKVAAKVADTEPAKPFTGDTEVIVEEDATVAPGSRTVTVKEMPANESAETISRAVAVPQKLLGGFKETDKPKVKDKLPEFPKAVGWFAGLALAGVAWMIFEVLKWAALAFAGIWLLRHLFPNLAIRRDERNATLRKVTGVKAIGTVDEAVKAFDGVVASLTDIHADHSKKAALAETRLSRLTPLSATAKKKAAPSVDQT